MTQKDAMIQGVHCTLDAIPAFPFKPVQGPSSGLIGELYSYHYMDLGMILASTVKLPE